MKVTRTTQQRYSTTVVAETKHPSYSMYPGGLRDDKTPVVSISNLYNHGPKIEVFLTREELGRLLSMFDNKPLTAHKVEG